MSIFVERKTFPIENILYSRFFGVQKESLADFVRKTRNDKNMSLMQVRLKSGKNLATSYISRIENGDVLNVGPQKLQALAKGLDVSEEILFSLVRGKAVDPARITNERWFSIAETYELMPDVIKKALEPFIVAFETSLESFQHSHFANDQQALRKFVLDKYTVTDDSEEDPEEDLPESFKLEKPSRRKAS